MSSANVLPSAAPPENIYPQIRPPDFRMQKVNEISTAMKKEVDHYRAVAKKYKHTKKVFFRPPFQAQVLVLLFLLSAYWPQYPLASLVCVSLSLHQGS